MKNQKFRVLLVLTLIFTLVISAPISVNAKSKNVAKPKYATAYTNFTNSPINGEKVSFYAYSKGAKKCEIYRADLLKGKYKKVATLKCGQGYIDDKYINSKSGLCFYKIRGINGSKKSPFSKSFAAYQADMSIENYNVNISDKSITFKFLVDNTQSTSNMVFVKNTNDYLSTSYTLSDDEMKERLKGKEILVDEDGFSYYINEVGEECYLGEEDIEENQFFKGKLIDEDGNDISSATIEKNTTGYIYMKYIYQEDKDVALHGGTTKQLNYAATALDRAFSGNDDRYHMRMNQTFKIKSKGKSYELFTDFNYLGETLSGYIYNWGGGFGG